MLLSRSNVIYDEYNIKPNNLLKQNKVVADRVNYIDIANTSISNTRYNKCRKLIKDNKIYYETYNKYGVAESTEDIYYKVDASTVDRLDIIANKVYNNSNYWWVIAIANDIIDPFNVEINTVLRIPAILSLYLRGGVLSDD